MEETLYGLFELFSNYYTFYAYLICSLSGALLYYRKKQYYKNDNWKKAVYLVSVCCLCIVLCFAFSYIVPLKKFGVKTELLLILVLSVASYCIGMLIAYMVPLVIDFIAKAIQRNTIKNNIWGIVFFLFFTIKFIIQVPPLQRWSLWSYAVDYSMGFAPRFLIGSVLSFITNGHPTYSAVSVFCFICTLLLIIVISIMFNALIKKSDEQFRPAVIFFSLCYMVSSGSIASYWTSSNYGRLDYYILLFALIAVILFHKTNNLYLKYLMLAVICLICNAIYQGFVFMFFSLIFIVMLGDIFTCSNDKKKRILLACFVLVITAVSFLVFQFYSSLKFSNAEEMIQFISARTDIAISEDPIKSEFFDSSISLYNYMLDSLQSNDNLREHLFVLMFFSVPQIVVFMKFFLSTKRRDIGRYSPVIVLSLSTLLFLIPQFFMNVDWGRWMVSGITTVYFTIFYLSYVHQIDIVAGLIEFTSELKKSGIVFALLLVYMSALSVIGAREISSDFNKILSLIAGIKNYIKAFSGV